MGDKGSNEQSSLNLVCHSSYALPKFITKQADLDQIVSMYGKIFLEFLTGIAKILLSHDLKCFYALG